MTAEDLAKGEGREGRDALRTALRELKAAGYIRTEALKRDAGRFQGIRTYVFDTPEGETNQKHGEPENPRAGIPPAQKPVCKSSKGITNRTEQQQGDRHQGAAAAPLTGKAVPQWTRRASGIECWDARDEAGAARLEEDQDPVAITTAVAAIEARDQSPAPGVVLTEIRRQRRAHGAAEARAKSPVINYDPVAARVAQMEADAAAQTITTLQEDYS